jgi:hypothetical protein
MKLTPDAPFPPSLCYSLRLFPLVLTIPSTPPGPSENIANEPGRNLLRGNAAGMSIYGGGGHRRALPCAAPWSPPTARHRRRPLQPPVRPQAASVFFFPNPRARAWSREGDDSCVCMGRRGRCSHAGLARLGPSLFLFLLFPPPSTWKSILGRPNLHIRTAQ